MRLLILGAFAIATVMGVSVLERPSATQGTAETWSTVETVTASAYRRPYGGTGRRQILS